MLIDENPAGAKVDEDLVAAGSASSEPLTMFVKNLAFSTTEAGLKSCFERAGLSVRSESIPRKKGQGSSEAMLSSGFGFVECADRELVEKALKVGGNLPSLAIAYQRLPSTGSFTRLLLCNGRHCWRWNSQ